MRMSEEDFAALISRRAPDIQSVIRKHGFTEGKVPEKKPRKVASTTGPNKTEAEYGRMLALEFPQCHIKYEGLTLHMSNGHAYTPDWLVFGPPLRLPLLVEVKARGKNGFRHPSYQRARLAYDQCANEYGCFSYRWAEKQAGKWDVTDF